MRGVCVGSVAERLEQLYMPDPNSGCWLWIGSLKMNGYGSIGIKIGNRWKTKLAHRISYETFIGPIPNGLPLDHKCRVRSCINPAHLEPVTPSENLRRSPLLNRQEHKTHCPQGHPYSGINSDGARICHICAAHSNRLWRARRGKS